MMLDFFPLKIFVVITIKAVNYSHFQINRPCELGLATIRITAMAVHNTVVDGCDLTIHRMYTYVSNCSTVQYGCIDGRLMVIMIVWQKNLVRLE
jgi:hypothetical protein